MKIRLGITASALSVLMLAGCASAPAAPTTVTKEAPAAVVTVTVAPTTAQTTTAEATAAEVSTPADEPTSEEMTWADATSDDPTTDDPPTDPPAAASPGSWSMVDMTGLRLQVAQDQVQVLSGNPMFVTDSTDATGAGRAQIDDLYWQVCSQTPLPGSTITADSKISFAAVKVGESCP